MANSSFDTFKQGGEAIDKAAEKTGQEAETLYDQAKARASDAYDSATDYAGDAVTRMQDGAAELDDMVSEQVGRHPKAMVALGVGIFAQPRAELARLREVGPLNPRGAAVGARVVHPFERPARVQHDRAGMAHGVGIAVCQYLHIVTGR